VSGRPAEARQRDLKQVIVAATKAGAREVRVKLSGGAESVIPLVPDDEPAEIADNSDNSFDKIMRTK
jgi:hypothetical protein